MEESVLVKDLPISFRRDLKKTKGTWINNGGSKINKCGSNEIFFLGSVECYFLCYFEIDHFAHNFTVSVYRSSPSFINKVSRIQSSSRMTP